MSTDEIRREQKVTDWLLVEKPQPPATTSDSQEQDKLGRITAAKCVQALSHKVVRESDLGAALPQGENWWSAEALDVIRFARTDEPHDTWQDWQNAIQAGLLRAFNRGQDSVSRAAQEPQPGVREALLEINADAEADILKGNPVTGAHHRAIERKLAALLAAKEPKTDGCKFHSS